MWSDKNTKMIPVEKKKKVYLLSIIEYWYEVSDYSSRNLSTYQENMLEEASDFCVSFHYFVYW